MKTVLRFDDGHYIELGEEQQVSAAWQDVIAVTGGSSAGGRFSRLFGVIDRSDPFLRCEANALSLEATDFADAAALQLQPQTVWVRLSRSPWNFAMTVR